MDNVHRHPPTSRQISCISRRPLTYSIRIVWSFSNGKAPCRLAIGNTRSLDVPLYDLQLWRPTSTSCINRTCGGLPDKTLFLSQGISGHCYIISPSRISGFHTLMRIGRASMWSTSMRAGGFRDPRRSHCPPLSN